MLSIHVKKQEAFNEETSTFLTIPECTLQLEHSLISLRKWESKWHVPFLGQGKKTPEQMLDYFRCMAINQVDPMVFYGLNKKNFEDISNYIEDPMTATWFDKVGKIFGKEPSNTVGASKKAGEVITAEIIYYWMIRLGIPVEFQKWHLNQLLTLIKVVSTKESESSPDKKRIDPKTAAMQRAMLNEQRKARLKTRG